MQYREDEYDTEATDRQTDIPTATPPVNTFSDQTMDIISSTWLIYLGEYKKGLSINK